MKRTGLWLAMACLALTGTVRADGWGRGIPNSFVSRYQDKAEVVQSPAGDAPVVQSPADAAPIITSPTPVQHDGYPFTNRCGAGETSCCNGVWGGYSRSCGGCGVSRACLPGCGVSVGRRAVGFGCGTCCDTGCGGGCFNSFAGGSCCSPCGGGGLGWSSGGLQAWGGCGCGTLRGGAFRRGWGLGCGSPCATGCASGCGTAVMGGCSSCGGGSPIQGHHSHDAGKVLPPAPVMDQAPTAEPTPAAPAANDKSAFRPRTPSPVYYRAGF